jgi:hypothetical protein
MSPFLRSAVRIPAACLATLAALLGVGAVAVTQPTFGRGPRWDGPHADPARLRRHVGYLTTHASPRDGDHPENLDRAEHGLFFDVLQSHPPTLAYLLPTFFYPTEEARIVLELVVEPVVLGLEADQDARWPPIFGDDNVLFLREPQVLRQIFSDF